MMEQPSWEGVVREGVVCPWSVGVETDTGVVDTEGHSPLVGLALRELQHWGGGQLCSHLGCFLALGLCGFECGGFCGA